MKQTLLIINLFLLGIIFFQACGSNKTDASLTQEEQRPDTCDRISFSGDLDSLVDNEIRFRTARSLSIQYRVDSGKKYIWKARQAQRENLDATSIWFGIDVLKKFIREIERKSCRMDCREKLGIRFYYARYPSLSELKDNPDFRDVDRRFADRHTIFMVPTFRDSARNKNLDFDLKVGHCRAVFDTAKDQSSLIFALGGLGRRIENHGGVAPPPATEGLFPTY
jgi:hypothetical protein